MRFGWSHCALAVGVVTGTLGLVLWETRPAAGLPVAKVAAEATPRSPPVSPPGATTTRGERAAPSSVPLGDPADNSGGEASLMAMLRRIQGDDPSRAVELAREGNRRFPESFDVSERKSILVHALAHLGRSAEARGEAEEMVNHDPDSAWVREVETFTGAHRHRNYRLNDAGDLESY